MEAKPRILLIQQDYYLGKTTQSQLEEYGKYQVFLCTNADVANAYFKRYAFDLCLIETGRLQKNGLELVTKIRNENSAIPLFLLTPNPTDVDRINGYEAGADACLTTPFCLEELVLRINAWLRRTKPIESSMGLQYRFEKNILFDYSERVLIQSNKVIAVTDRTRELMKFLMDHPNKPLTKEEIATEIWGKYDFMISRSMDVFITKIRHYFVGCLSVNLKTLSRYGYIFLVSQMAVFQNGQLMKQIEQEYPEGIVRQLYGNRKEAINQ